jgi:ABC-type sulfate/molybdate transport systems ATPase subunit
VIELEHVAARRRPLALSRISHVWGAGSHAVIGSRGDGGSLLLALIGGLARPRSGRVRVLDGAPIEAGVRRRIALVPVEPALPEAMRVSEALDLAAAVRKEAQRDVAERLSVLGVETLAGRRVRSLSRAEARAVALAEALTSPSVRVLLVEEPLVAMDPRAVGRVPEALRARGRDGCAVVVTTASMRDAGELADDWVALRAGAIVGEAAWIDTPAVVDRDGASLHVILRAAGDAPAFLAALAREGDIGAIERERGAVRLRGRDAIALARAVGRAALEADVDVVELRIDPAARSASDRASGGTA